MNFRSSVPCNPAPKFRRTSSRRRPRHASRPFPSLSFASPAPHPEGCIRWRASQLSLGATESPLVKNCLARPPLSVACFSVSLSSFGLHRVGVPRSIHESSPNVKLIFQKFCIFLWENFKNIEKSMFSKITFLALFRKSPHFASFFRTKPPLPCTFCTNLTKPANFTQMHPC